MSNLTNKPIIHQDCVACGVCTAACPLQIITIYKGLTASINTEKCISCGKCVKACPAGAIEILKREELDYNEKTMA